VRVILFYLLYLPLSLRVLSRAVVFCVCGVWG
jgi:hypothetical protein